MRTGGNVVYSAVRMDPVISVRVLHFDSSKHGPHSKNPLPDSIVMALMTNDKVCVSYRE